jgi:hypothetical protein
MLRGPLRRTTSWVLLAGLVASVGAATGVNAYPAAPDSTLRSLPFEPIEQPGDIFAASKLTRTYAKDLTPLLWADRRAKRTDLETLDEYASADPSFSSDPDSTDIQLLRERARRSAAEMTPEEKAAAEAPQAGVHVGIPSSISTTATMIGGIALLAKILTEFFK